MMEHDDKIYMEESKKPYSVRLLYALITTSALFLCGVLLTLTFIAVSVPGAFQEYAFSENYSVHYDEETFNVMRGEYARETDGEFNEDEYCMYGEANESGIYIKELKKAWNHQAGTYNITTDEGVEQVEGVYGDCIRPEIPLSSYDIGGLQNDPGLALEMGVNFFKHEVMEKNYTMRYLGSCHSHPPDNSKHLSQADLKTWKYAPIKCIMFREDPYIYTQQRFYTHAN